jgi:signal transduction histidine kinase
MDTHARLLHAVQKATRKLVSSGDLEHLFPDVLAICVDASGATGGTIYLHDPEARRLRFQYVLPEEVADRLPFKDIADDFGVAGRVFHTRRTEISRFHVEVEGEHAPAAAENPRAHIEASTGIVVRTMITVPLMMEDEEPIGVVQLINKQGGEFTDADATVLDTVAAVSTMAFLNSRLVEESTRASSLLGMGKVCHDIGNLASDLSATVSMSELTAQDLTGRLPSDLLGGALADSADTLHLMFEELKHSVGRIAGYARLISDLSAGRPLRPSLRLGPLAPVIRQSAAYLVTDGLHNHVDLRFDLQEDAPPTVYDDLYLSRIVQNLVGNGIKAVRETIPEPWLARFGGLEEATWGAVTVRYRFQDGRHLLEVADAGPGMSPEVIRRILAGRARSHWGRATGSGWGLKIVLELAATLGATVEIDSQPGRGTTFRVGFPCPLETP